MRSRVVILIVIVGVGAALWGVRQARISRKPAYSEDPPRILIIGVDGIDWDRLDARITDGAMPNIGRLRDSGASGVHHSIYPYYSPVIWTSMATGKGEDKHGVHGFKAGLRASSSDGLVDSNDRKVKAFWQILSEAGRTVGVINWLVTWPAEEVSGYLISSRACMFLHMKTSMDSGQPEMEAMRPGVYPPELWDTVLTFRRGREAVGDDRIAGLLASPDYSDERLTTAAVEQLARIYADDLTVQNIARNMMQNAPTDVTAVYFRGSDIISHFFWKYMEPESWGQELEEKDVYALGQVIDRYYASVDSIVGTVLDLRGPNTVVVFCSDHGFAGHSGYPGFEGGVARGIQMHREEGVIILNGPGIVAGAEIEGASPLDLTPTVLALSGLPVAEDMDGRVLTEAIDPVFFEYHPLSTIGTYESASASADEGEETLSSPIDDKVVEQLRAIGYIN